VQVLKCRLLLSSLADPATWGSSSSRSSRRLIECAFAVMPLSYVAASSLQQPAPIIKLLLPSVHEEQLIRVYRSNKGA